MSDQPIRVMLIEDHPAYREVVEIAISREPDFEMIGTYGAVEVAQRSLLNRDERNMPDVILLDLNLPGISGLEGIPVLASTFPDAKILVLTQSEQEADVIQAITQGASSYLVKSATAAQIKSSIRGVVKGEATLDSRVARYVLNTLCEVLPKETIENELTPRELEVLSLIADGMTKKEIAKALQLSTSTVSTHVVHVFEKLHVSNAPAAIAKAFRSGLLPSSTKK
ncbi:LuxR C-terminal-related transcriptional regulator [Novipirellula aureliae]|nr:response regulator transcription factor [Novipirellula aureliae]